MLSSDVVLLQGYEGKPKAYIATQAPMENTVDDFWSMVMEQNVSVIIMVTYLYEYGVVGDLLVS